MGRAAVDVVCELGVTLTISRRAQRSYFHGASTPEVRLTTKLSDGTPAAPKARGRNAPAQKVMVRARAPALYGSVGEHFMGPRSLQRLVRRRGEGLLRIAPTAITIVQVLLRTKRHEASKSFRSDSWSILERRARTASYGR